MRLTPLVVAWAFLAMVVIGLAVYRKIVAWTEDDVLHVSDGEAAAVVRQAAIARKLEVIDRWGKLLTAVLLIQGLLMAGYFVYLDWLEANATALSMR